MLRLLAVCVIAVLTPNLSPATIYPFQAPDQGFVVVSGLYDATGQAGLRYYMSVPQEGWRTSILLDQVVIYSREEFGMPTYTPFPLPMGLEYEFSLEHPSVGCLTGASKVGMYFPTTVGWLDNDPRINPQLVPSYVVPCLPEQLSVPLFARPFDPPGSSTEARIFAQDPLISDDRTSFSLAIASICIPDLLERGKVVSLELLDPVTSVTVESVVRRFTQPIFPSSGRNGSVFVRVSYTTHEYSAVNHEEQAGIFIVKRSTLSSLPARITFSIDGYTSDTLTFHKGLLADREVLWTPVLGPGTGPDAGPLPSELAISPTLLESATENGILGVCQPAFTLRRTTDGNRDGARDAADLISHQLAE